jgi:predicted esterase
VVTLHGAGGDAEAGLALWQPLADVHQLVLLAPESRGSTWDAMGGRFGPDVEYVDRALTRVFELVTLDRCRLTLSGFSDGASYALSLCLANGDLFPHLTAFSPGFIAPAPRIGKSRIFISHGIDDQVLPISRTSRRIVPALRRQGYEVNYREFAGSHIIPPGIVQDALAWLEQ